MVQVAIAAGSQIAADAGAAIADQGGNAVDATLAAALVSMGTDLGVIALGAGGFITIWPPAEDPVVIDGYAEMPGRGMPPERVGQSTQRIFFDYGGPISNVVGHGTVATPGMFAGLGMASTQYGAISWPDVVAPAIHWAEAGFPLTGGAAEYLAHAHTAIFGWQPESYDALHPEGGCWQAGDLVHIPGLAESLAQIAREGAGTCYQGELGRRIAEEIQVHGGLLTVTDLDAYQAQARSPIRLRYGEWDLATNPAPAIGGACLGALLLLREGFRSIKSPHRSDLQWDAAAVQDWIEIQQTVLDYRCRKLEGRIENTQAIAQLLEIAHHQGHEGLKSPSTIHISAVDSSGLACSLSASAGYGSGVLVPGTGIWLNNSLGEVDLYPQGLQGVPAGTRLASNMAPTIARHQDGTVLAIGSPGASRITTALAQVLTNFMLLEMDLEAAISHPRLHVERVEEALAVAFETGLPLAVHDRWVPRQFPVRSMYFGGVQAALFNPHAGLYAVADPRRIGGVARGGT